MLCLLYESLLTLAVRESGLLEFKDKALTGGGRIGSNEVGIGYLVLVSNLFTVCKIVSPKQRRGGRSFATVCGISVFLAPRLFTEW